MVEISGIRWKNEQFRWQFGGVSPRKSFDHTTESSALAYIGLTLLEMVGPAATARNGPNSGESSSHESGACTLLMLLRLQDSDP